MIPDSFIQSLLERVDVADVVGRYVQLRKAGANLLGLCPFHNEKSPSFTVSPSKQFYHCFGCGAHGSAIRFLMEHTGANFPEAVRQLADSVGMVVPDEPRGPGGRAARAEREQRQAEMSRHSQVLETANAFYRRNLRTATAAIEYLKGRGVSGQIAARYGLGWAGPERQGLAAAFPEYSDPEFSAFLVEAGIVIESDDGRRYDRFRQRVTFPIRNARGHLIGFGGRVIGQGEPKYLNSPETPVFSKGTELYGLWEARQAIRLAGLVVVVEGYMDVVALAQMGVDNAVATLGTATTPQHIQKLLRATDQIVFSFDGDKAGRKAAWRALQACLPLLRDDISIRFLFLPEGHDPDSYVREHGADGFRQALQGALPLSRFMLGELADQHDLAQPEGRARCIHDAQPLMQAMPAGALRMQVVRELAEMVRLTPDELNPLLALQDKPSGPLIPQSRSAAPQPRAPLAAEATSGGPTDASHAPPDFDMPPPDYESVPVDFDESSGGIPGTPAGRDQWKQRGKWKRDGKWRRGDRDDEAELFRRDGRRKPVPGLPHRLLRLLLTHPQLVEDIDSTAEAYLAASQGFESVCALIAALRASRAQHAGAVLQAVAGTALEPELHRAAADTLLVDELPDPCAELSDTLRSVILQAIRSEQAELAVRAASDPEALQRYIELNKEVLRLRGG
jgi:DNA primase